VSNLITYKGRLLSFLVVFLFLCSGVETWAQVKYPRGNYKDTCRSISILGNRLLAQCHRDDGKWQNSEIKWTDCEGDIRNVNGELICKHKAKPIKPVPKGSYKNTCKDIRLDGDYLRAKCEKRNGVWNNTKIKYNKCSGDIWNDNGELACNGSGSGNVPRGSYKSSCKYYYVEGNKLYAKCEKKNGGWHNTSINYKNCNQDIWNDNGNLTCGNRNSGGKLPKGSYKNSCKNIHVDGNVLKANCLNRNGKYSHTSIKYKKCNHGVYNDRGQLRCN
jgi:hypothetical protein